MNPILLQVLSAILWSLAAVIISQLVSIGLMSWLGLPIKKLTHEIEDVQNPAVGASFFIISLAVAFFVGMFTTDIFIRDPQPALPFLNNLLWILGALVLSSLIVFVNFQIAYNLMGKEQHGELDRKESMMEYIRRELIEEQNASLALFLGGLAVVPFIAVTFHFV